jgi:2-keto-4-pentenoate hydratase/2-oxohepta-3-ene-1,7-dioic acid hydratase in catechol pathway
VAAGYKGEGSWWLKNGDVIESEIEKIGLLRNPVSTRKRRS